MQRQPLRHLRLRRGLHRVQRRQVQLHQLRLFRRRLRPQRLVLQLLQRLSPASLVPARHHHHRAPPRQLHRRRIPHATIRPGNVKPLARLRAHLRQRPLLAHQPILCRPPTFVSSPSTPTPGASRLTSRNIALLHRVLCVKALAFGRKNGSIPSPAPLQSPSSPRPAQTPPPPGSRSSPPCHSKTHAPRCTRPAPPAAAHRHTLSNPAAS